MKEQPVNLVKALEYQADAIVSKTLLDKTAGTVTLFAFDAGQGLSEHTAPFDAILQVLDGEATVSVSGVSALVEKGEMMMLPAGKPHSLHAGKRFKMLLTMIKV